MGQFDWTMYSLLPRGWVFDDSRFSEFWIKVARYFQSLWCQTYLWDASANKAYLCLKKTWRTASFEPWSEDKKLLWSEFLKKKLFCSILLQDFLPKKFLQWQIMKRQIWRDLWIKLNIIIRSKSARIGKHLEEMDSWGHPIEPLEIN